MPPTIRERAATSCVLDFVQEGIDPRRIDCARVCGALAQPDGALADEISVALEGVGKNRCSVEVRDSASSENGGSMHHGIGAWDPEVSDAVVQASLRYERCTTATICRAFVLQGLPNLGGGGSPAVPAEFGPISIKFGRSSTNM